MRFALMAVAAALFATVASAANYDLEQMQARLAQQEARMAEQDARMNDLQAKLAGGRSGDVESAEGLISLRKNAVVSIGGQLVTKYQGTRAKIDSVYERDDATVPDEVHYIRTNDYRRRADSKTSSLEVSDAYISMQIDVNDYFDAYLELDLHNGANDDYYLPEVYYVRWKNVCESGFSLKVGRDALVFGEDGVGELGSYAAGYGDGIAELNEDFLGHSGWLLPADPANFGPGAFEAGGGGVPLHNGWDVSGVTQITPSWEGLDGKLTAELSLFQNVYDDGPQATGIQEGSMYHYDRGNVRKYRSRNYGVGSFTARVAFEPIENLKFTASFGNYRSRGEWGMGNEYNEVHTNNNTIYGLAASWRPCFFNRLNLWGQWVHGNNVYFHRGMKSDAVNFGASFDITENLVVFAQGDYLRTSYKHAGLNQRANAWASYAGIQYSLPYGVSMEAGWKHEQVKYKDRVAGERLAKIKGDTIYAMLGFEF